ncbi:PocR ligand-binding domain-containing protein [Anaeromyxobacter terrae]|uniref:PocR ligand-binding domain-containing protein n=1 Tax=Anaeromyxobacter terrae TaxID=2925406 RepID=UPI001F59D39D|nr:PocR ligand-binding domain-containing protein [Anaeromyxobacter sp. SG22]
MAPIAIPSVRLPALLDMSIVQRLAEANYNATGMPIGIIDAFDGSVLVGCGWQDICVHFHRADPRSLERCRESDDYIKSHLTTGASCEYLCKNGLRDIGVPIVVAGEHLATLFLGQFFYEDESADREFFVRQARQFGYDEPAYLAALDRVPVFDRRSVENIVAYDRALVRFIGELAEGALRQRQAEEALRDADRRKDEFLSVLSHELRNPLAPIRNSIYILEHAEPAGEQARRARAVIERQTEHLTKLVDDLLDVTRIAKGKIELRRERVDVAAVARRASEDLRSVIAGRGLALALDLPSDPVPVDGDPTRLAQVLGNLLQNATKFTPRGGTITVSVRAGAEATELTVRDTGVGIARNMLGRIFEPFVQAERSLARTDGGLGLGLALVKGVTELHGGTVRAESAGPGQGTEIIVRLPLAAEKVLPASAAAGVSPMARGRLVLVVDDNVDAADSLAELVQLFGHQTEVAYDGPTALAMARANPPDVVLCDLGLPGMSGYDVARALRAGGSNGVRLVAVSGYAQPDDLKRATDAGFDGHVAKPPDPGVIERILG